jgi:hypothetical protein
MRLTFKAFNMPGHKGYLIKKLSGRQSVKNWTNLFCWLNPSCTSDAVIFEYCMKFPPHDESKNYVSIDSKWMFHAWWLQGSYRICHYRYLRNCSSFLHEVQVAVLFLVISGLNTLINHKSSYSTFLRSYIQISALDWTSCLKGFHHCLSLFSQMSEHYLKLGCGHLDLWLKVWAFSIRTF